MTGAAPAKNIGFGADSWHLDTSRDNYEKRWGDLLDHYAFVLSAYGEDNDLTQLMKLELSEALNKARKWIENPSYGNKEYISNLSIAINNISNRAKTLGVPTS